MCLSEQKKSDETKPSPPRTVRTFSSISEQEGSKLTQQFIRTKVDVRRRYTSTITLVVDDGSTSDKDDEPGAKLLGIYHASVYRESTSGFYSQTVLDYTWDSGKPDTYTVSRKYVEKSTATGMTNNVGNSGEQKFLRGFDPNAVLAALNGDDENDIERFLEEYLPLELGLQFRGK